MKNEIIELETQTTELDVIQEVPNMTLEKKMELATLISKTTIVPQQYINNVGSCFIAIDMAEKMGMNAMTIMQNLYIVNGKPSFAGSFIASLIRSSKQFKNVELNYVGEPNTDSWGAYVTAERVSNGTKITGATVTIGIAKKEGWYSKTGSKWQTMPELMLCYRAYAWFGRMYSPELMVGMHSTDEIIDSTPIAMEIVNPYGDE